LSGPAAHLLVIGEREALAWVLSEQRMAFPATREREALALERDALLLLYTTRGCFHNPTRDRGRIIGQARVTSSPRRLADPVRFGEREYPIGCSLAVQRLVARGEGVELARLVPRMAAFPDAATWSVRLRRSLVPLGDHDLALARGELERLPSGSVDDAVATYVAAVP
jgi:hypothetical protein